MHKLLPVFLFFAFTTNCFCQTKLYDLDSIIKNYQPRYSNKEKIKLLQAEAPKDFQLPGIAADTAIFTHRTELGEVYTLPGENMPILRPFNIELSWGYKTILPPNIQLLKTTPAYKIPNVYEEKSLYFQKTPTLPDEKAVNEY
jgi:hypothetical protein